MRRLPPRPPLRSDRGYYKSPFGLSIRSLRPGHRNSSPNALRVQVEYNLHTLLTTPPLTECLGAPNIISHDLETADVAMSPD